MFDLSVYFEWFKGLPPELATMLIGTLPFAESRVAVPVAIIYFKLPAVWAVIYSALGDLIPTLFILNLLGPVSGWLIRHFRLAEKFFHWLFEHTRHKFVGKYEKYGLLALTIFVAIPMPGTGSWAGSVASFVFGIPKRKAFVFIAIGVLIAASLVALVTNGVSGVAGWLV